MVELTLSIKFHSYSKVPDFRNETDTTSSTNAHLYNHVYVYVLRCHVACEHLQFEMAALEIRKLERRGSSPAELVELFASKESGGVSY